MNPPGGSGLATESFYGLSPSGCLIIITYYIIIHIQHNNISPTCAIVQVKVLAYSCYLIRFDELSAAPSWLVVALPCST